MKKDYEKFRDFETKESFVGLFDRIILAIKREQELRQTKRLLFGFSFFLLTSLVVTPLSGAILANQIEASGISYFITVATSDLGIFFAFWQDFSLAILESLPILGITAFLLSLAVSVFTLRLFLYRRKLLFGCLIKSFTLKTY